MASEAPVTTQISRQQQAIRRPPVRFKVSDVEGCLVQDRQGNAVPFKSLYEGSKSIVVFVRESEVRLVVIGQSSYHHIESFCSLTGYPHEIYVDPDRSIYKILGMRRGETFLESASKSPHVKSSLLMGNIRSMWRAMRSPMFDFQGDPLQQGGALVMGPGPEVHFAHFDMNRLDHMPINWLLQLAGLKMLDFSGRSKIFDI
ncbi:peroxiredoxin-like 2C isoform X2 [Denticeps clupeoides]|uniref:peroxiredoxin-like 2C isoform X2 n=1 Tax=Denticeps clupeoides TaxID=299321 RepID=UPI0010A36D1B|nr:peroxiredoxin-like 2C isoform X2 [Denticeps clupeoides]